MAREVYSGRLWAARPVHLLELEPDLMVAHFSHGSSWLRPVKLDGSNHRLPEGPWRLKRTEWQMDSVWFVPSAQPFAIHTMRLLPGDDLKGWYINVQEPARPSVDGFDYMDLTLDIVAAPDLSTWELKDEGELAHAHSIGLYDKADVLAIRQAAEAGLEFLQEHVGWMRALQQCHSVSRPPLAIPDDGQDSRV